MLRHPIPTDRWDRAINALDNLTPSLKDRLHEALPTEWGVDRTQTDPIIDYVLHRTAYTREILEKLKEEQGR